MTARIRNVLEGTAAPPDGWYRADDALIPKALGAVIAGDFHPITVLPVILKMTLRCWMTAATPLLSLRRYPSHGCREGVQATEVDFAVRALMQKHREHGRSIVVAQLDIRKAYDTLSWPARQSMFERRGLPPALQDAYWRMHRGRRLQFRTSCGAVRFGATPTQGIPRGSPESPLVYAAVMGMIT